MDLNHNNNFTVKISKQFPSKMRLMLSSIVKVHHEMQSLKQSQQNGSIDATQLPKTAESIQQKRQKSVDSVAMNDYGENALDRNQLKRVFNKIKPQNPLDINKLVRSEYDQKIDNPLNKNQLKKALEMNKIQRQSENIKKSNDYGEESLNKNSLKRVLNKIEPNKGSRTDTSNDKFKKVTQK